MRFAPLIGASRGVGRGGVVAALVTVVVIGCSSVAGAAFGDSASAGHTVGTATLRPPSNPSAGPGACTSLSDTIVVSWTKTESAWADGYEVLSSLSSGGPYTVVAAVSGRDTESATVRNGLFNTTYFLVVRATKSQWRSAVTAEVAHRTRTVCT